MPGTQPRPEPHRSASDTEVLAALAVGVIVHGDDGSIMSCNQAALDILGVERAALLEPDEGRLRRDVVSEEGVPLRADEVPVASTLVTGVDVTDRVIGLRRADGFTWVSVSTRLVPLGEDRRSVVVTLVDITARFEGLRVLRQAHQSFDVGFDESPIAMLVVDRDGLVTRTNAALEQMTQWSADDLRGRGLGRLLHPDDMALAQRARAAFVRGEVQQLHANRRLLTKSGAVVHVIVSTLPVRNERGELSHYVTHLVDVTEQRQRHDELSFLADHDPLTGLVNRRGFEIALADCLANHVDHRPAALLMIDLDRFKQVNDVHGHALGDLLIKGVAEVISSVAGASCVVGRIGGDEFVVLVLDTTVERAADLAQQLVDAVGSMPGGEVTLTDGRVGASIGVAMVPIGGSDGSSLLDRADRALYQAKRAGRGVWALASEQ